VRSWSQPRPRNSICLHYCRVIHQSARLKCCPFGLRPIDVSGYYSRSRGRWTSLRQDLHTILLYLGMSKYAIRESILAFQSMGIPADFRLLLFQICIVFDKDFCYLDICVIGIPRPHMGSSHSVILKHLISSWRSLRHTYRRTVCVCDVDSAPARKAH
jgi:hypothetical protein